MQLSCSGADDGPAVQQTDRSGFEGGAAHTQRSALIADESFQVVQARASEVEDPSTRFSAATQRKAADGAVSAIKSRLPPGLACELRGHTGRTMLAGSARRRPCVLALLTCLPMSAPFSCVPAHGAPRRQRCPGLAAPTQCIRAACLRTHIQMEQRAREPPLFERSFWSSFTTAIALLLFVRTFLVEPYFIPSSSMASTLSANDHIAVEKFSKFVSPPHRGDILVFRPPAAYFEREGGGKPGDEQVVLVKRVIGVSGDVVEVRGGVVLLNGQPRFEPYLSEEAQYSFAPVSVPRGAVFVLGDNRNLSTDSHVWGCVPLTNVIGKAFYVLWPQDHQGFVDQFMQDLEIEGVRAFTDRING